MNLYYLLKTLKHLEVEVQHQLLKNKWFENTHVKIFVWSRDTALKNVSLFFNQHLYFLSANFK